MKSTVSKEQSEAISTTPNLSVVIPAFNEEGGIAETIKELRHYLQPLNIPFEIVVVDDASRDKTREIAEQSGATVISNEQNQGYGASLKRGIAASDSTYVAIIDADHTYPASNLPKMLAQIQSADMVVGARSASMTNVPLIRRPAKFFFNNFVNFLANKKIPDINSGLRVFRRSALTPFLPLLPRGFSFTTTITLCMVCSNSIVEYIPIEYRRRVGKSSMKPRDFFKFLLLVVRAVVLFSPLRVFIPLGTLLFLAGAAKFIYDAWLDNLSESAVLGLLAAIIIWSFGLLADMISRLHLRR